MISRSPISMVSGPVWGEKTDNLNRQQVSEIGKLAGPITTHSEVNIKFDGDQTRSHSLANCPTMAFPQGPPSSDGLGKYTSRIE